MSYDIYLEELAAGEEEPGAAVFWINYTSNCAPMWREAMPASDGLAGLHGHSAAVAELVLREGIRAMEQDPDRYRALNPPNSWGDYDGQLAMLRKLRAACQAHPETTVRIWR